MAAAHAPLWRRHRWTALRSLLLVALLHRLHCLAFLAASSPVWLLAAFLLGVVLVHSEPNVPLAAAASEDEDRHLTTDATGGRSSSGSSDDGSSVTSMEDEHLRRRDVAWTADDERSIQSIGSLELERDATLEKLMSRRSIHRNLIDLDIHIPAVLTSRNPFDHHHHHHDDPGSAPSALLGHHSNPFDFDVHQRDPDMLMRRHESFTAPPARPSRFRPYFVADVGGGDTGSDNSNNSSSSPSSSSEASDQILQAQQQAAAAKVVVVVEEEEAPPAAASPSPPNNSKWGGTGNGMGVAVDVELISDSSDDDMSLPGDDAAGSLNNPRDEDEEDSFEVESITQQVAAGQPRDVNVMPSPGQGEEDASISSCSREWVAPTTTTLEESEIREHHIMGPVPVTDDDASTATAAAAAAAVVAAAAPPPAAAAATAPRPVAAAVVAAAAPPPAAAANAAPQPAAAAPPPAAAAPAPAPSRAPSVKPSSKSKATSKKAVFGFFRK